EVEVLERAPTVRPVGAGLTLQSNAMRMLDALGLGEAVEAAGWPLTNARVARTDGSTLASLVGDPRARTGVAIHRGALSRLLVEALPEGVVHVGAGVTEVWPDGRVALADGTERRFDAVVGADGIHSVTRRCVVGGPSVLRYSGYTCWRGLAQIRAREGLAERWGRGRRFGTVPLGGPGAPTYWFATDNAPAGGVDGADPHAELIGRFAAFEPVVTDLIRSTPTILRHDLADLPPLRRWTRGRVTLLGDAAHPMTPNLGQGAGQAIEDAVWLAHTVSEHGLPEGLAAYEDARRPRATQFVRRSYRLGAVAQWSSPLACFVRDQAIALTPPALTRRSVARWLDVEVPRLTA
ncbi:MAG: FAD-dependent monooxygenase, partial [Myxococcota bacterium]